VKNTIALLLVVCAGACATPRGPRAPLAVVSRADGAILGLTEHDEDGGETPLDRAVRFIDANSRIEVKIDKAALRAALPEDLLPEGIDEELERLQALQAFTVEALKQTDTILEASKAYGEDPRRVGELLAAMDAGARNAIPLLEAITKSDHPLNELDSVLSARLDLSATAGGYRELFEVVGEHATEQLRRIDAELTGFAVLLEARLRAGGEVRNVHLPNFDEYPEGETFHVQRWQYAPSAEQEKALEELKSVAEELNSGQLSLRALLREKARGAVEALEKGARRCLDEAREGLERLSTVPELAAKAAELRALLADTSALKEHLRELRARYLEVQSDSIPLASLPVDLRDTVGRIRALGSSLRAFLEGAQATIDALAPGLRAVRDDLLACAEDLVTELGPIGDGLLAYFGDRLEMLRQAELDHRQARGR
jgi:hypothetical protein